MRSLDELLIDAATMHRGCVCPGQVLGVRMAMLGCQLLGIDEPTQGKRLIVYVEIDRCMADAIAAVTGCRLGQADSETYGLWESVLALSSIRQRVVLSASQLVKTLVPMCGVMRRLAWIRVRPNAMPIKSCLMTSCLSSKRSWSISRIMTSLEDRSAGWSAPFVVRESTTDERCD